MNTYCNMYDDDNVNDVVKPVLSGISPLLQTAAFFSFWPQQLWIGNFETRCHFKCIVVAMSTTWTMPSFNPASRFIRPDT